MKVKKPKSIREEEFDFNLKFNLDGVDYAHNNNSSFGMKWSVCISVCAPTFVGPSTPWCCQVSWDSHQKDYLKSLHQKDL